MWTGNVNLQTNLVIRTKIVMVLTFALIMNVKKSAVKTEIV